MSAAGWPLELLVIALGSALGGCARYGLGLLVQGWTRSAFPWGTLTVNVTGCVLIGALDAAVAPDGALWRAFLIVGVCGGYTTFSSFSLQLLELVRAGRTVQAGAYVAGSVLLCLLATWAGYGAFA